MKIVLYSSSAWRSAFKKDCVQPPSCVVDRRAGGSLSRRPQGSFWQRQRWIKKKLLSVISFAITAIILTCYIRRKFYLFLAFFQHFQDLLYAHTFKRKSSSHLVHSWLLIVSKGRWWPIWVWDTTTLPTPSSKLDTISSSKVFPNNISQEKSEKN